MENDAGNRLKERYSDAFQLLDRAVGEKDDEVAIFFYMEALQLFMLILRGIYPQKGMFLSLNYPLALH